MGNSDSISEEMGSIFEELDSAGASAPASVAAEPASKGSSVDPIVLPEVAGDGQDPANSIAQQVAEFTPLNRRRVRGNPELDAAELARWTELRELLDYAFGSLSPPLGATNRFAFRVSSQLKARLSGAGESIATVSNLSEKGGFIEIEAPPAPGTSLSLEIETGGSGPVVNVEACVKWSREIGNMDGPAGAGVEFTAIEDRDIALLERIVEQLLVLAAKKAG
jgi:hypothetical protein